MMDIFKNWREGKKKHDERVDSAYKPVPHDIASVQVLLRQISDARSMHIDTDDIEAKLWLVMSDYAAERYRSLQRPPVKFPNGGRLGQAHPNIKFDPEITKPWSEVNEIINRGLSRTTKYGQTQVVNSPTNARVKRQDPLKEELRERRENGIKNEAGV